MDQRLIIKPEDVILPNIRKIFIPDNHYDIFEADLSGADAQVVAWEAEDEDLKAAFKAGLDVHSKNAEDMWGSSFTNLPAGSYARSRRRQQLKQGVHATNYGGSARNLASILGWTVHETDLFQRRWFSLHPGIPRNFHGKTKSELATSSSCTNRFGYRRIFFDRPDNSFTEALAWKPQSTVALVSFYGALQLEQRMPFVEMLLQVHDSLVFQIPRYRMGQIQALATQLKLDLSYPIPYDDPLTIPWGLKHSSISWGDCAKV